MMVKIMKLTWYAFGFLILWKILFKKKREQDQHYNVEEY
jgi:hypothetical protein